MAEVTPRRISSVIHDRPAPAEGRTIQRPPVKARASVYLIGSTLEKFKTSKLPKLHDVLARFIAVFRVIQCIKTAADVTANEVIDVWKHHFGLRLTLGKDHENQKTTSSSLK